MHKTHDQVETFCVLQASLVRGGTCLFTTKLFDIEIQEKDRYVKTALHFALELDIYIYGHLENGERGLAIPMNYTKSYFCFTNFLVILISDEIHQLSNIFSETATLVVF